MRGRIFETIFYFVSVAGVVFGAIFLLSGWAFQTQANADEIKQLKNQYTEIISRLIRLEDEVTGKR